MVKSADSGQIAKARQWLRELLEGVGVSHITYACFEDKHGKGWSVPELLAAFAASERQAVKEECCRAVCYFCVGEPWKPAKLVNGAWTHECVIGPDPIAQCRAAAIRSME